MRPECAEAPRTVSSMQRSAVGVPWHGRWFEAPLKFLLRCPKKTRTYVRGINLEQHRGGCPGPAKNGYDGIECELRRLSHSTGEGTLQGLYHLLLLSLQ